MERSLAEIGRKFDTDKTLSHGYTEHYERHVGHLRNMPVRLLEIGVLRGGSLQMWQEYFLQGLIVGLDLEPNPFTKMPDRVRFYQGSQDDGALLDKVAGECAPDGFDIVIDDAAHVGELSRASYRNLFVKHLKRGGVYVVEDWGTGYWDSWPDGATYRMGPQKQAGRSKGQMPLLRRLARRLGWSKSGSAARSGPDRNFTVHNFGMVGFVKELVDEVGWPDIVSPERGNRELPQRRSMIREMTIYGGQVFLVKA